MSDPVLHIKDSFFFEVPKVLAPADFKKREEFPDVWIALDPDFQDWEFHRLIHALEKLPFRLPDEETLHHEWHEWVHGDHANFAKPFSEFLEQKYRDHLADFHAWRAAKVAGAKDATEAAKSQKLVFDDYVKFKRSEERDEFLNWSAWRDIHANRSEWAAIRHEAGSVEDYRTDESVPEWSAEKIAAYNRHLSGKVIIPQPFGRLRNLHEPATTLINPADQWASDGIINQHDFGFCISRFMLIEVAVGLILWILFSWVATRLMRGGPPQGRLWNLLESFVAFIREQIARPALGGGHHESHDEAHGQGHGDAHHGETAHAVKHDAPHHDHDDPVTRYTPVLCTIFFFILGCNLAGMLPWVGSPTGTWAVTLAMAFVTLSAVTLAGMRQFGFFGFFLNQIPSMDLPLYMAVVLKPILLVIELLGFVIKHGVLSVRLLANMLAGHMVLLAIMGMAFGLEAALTFTQPDGTVSIFWWIASISAIVGCTLLSLLELFVAFLQAYVFTLLSALFIGAAIHKH